MSYPNPGYPYHQGPPQGMPGAYPQQSAPPPSSPYPTGQAPYPQQPSPYPQQQSQSPYPPQQSPYPNYPSGAPGYPQAPYPNQFGANFGYNAAPSYMPQPYSMPMPHQAHSQPSFMPPPNHQSPLHQAQAPPHSQAPPHPQAPHSQAPPQHEYVPPPMHSGGYQSAPPMHNPYGQQYNTPKKGTPTVFPADPFDPRGDAETLRKAMKGFGTDEKAIIQVLANRTNGQRLEIANQFKTLYGKDMNKDLKSELSGRFEDLVISMMTPLPQFYAKEVHDALSGIGTDEDTLIEVFCTMTNNEIRTIRVAYEAMYGSSLENDLCGDTSGTFRRLMVSLCTANRDESMVSNPTGVTQDAQSLLRAGEIRLGTDESTFNSILCQRNYVHLRAVFDEYARITGHDFEKAVKNEFSGDAEEGLLAIVRSVKDKATFFAKRIHESMKGMGTKDRQLIRLIVTRSEVDMADIKEAYQAKYGQSLPDAIAGDTSGDYKKCLIALIS